MGLPIAYTALVTAPEVIADALQSTTLSEWDDNDAVVRAIEDVTSTIEEHLGRDLIVREQTLRFHQSQWRTDQRYIAQEALDLTYVAFAGQWPVLEVLEVDGDSAKAAHMQIFDDGRKIGYESSTVVYQHPAYVKVFAGYRRRDQDIAALQAELATLTVLPPQLPGKIRKAAAELALHRLFAAESKQFGTGRRMQQVGSGSMVTVESVDRHFEERVLSQLESGVKVLA